MQSQWEVKRIGVSKWALWSRSKVAGEPFSSWQKMGTYSTRSDAQLKEHHMRHILTETAETIGFFAIISALLFVWIATP